ncbi:MAG: HAD-IA family hydrolase [Euryarchaeota archaeon]|nr:HAD-IA family hydrolase [Euryarchaeota archaeon]
MTLAAVAFDLDATLIDFVRFKRVSSEEAARAMVDAGLPMAVEEAEQKLIDTYYEVGIDSDTAFNEFLQRAMGRVDERILAAGIEGYLRTKRALVAPYPGTGKTLLELIKKGLRLAIITDAPGLKARQRLYSMGLADYFDTVITMTEFPTGKADEKPFLHLAEKFGVKPGEVAMVGDNPPRDVTPAKKAGLKTVLAEYGYRTWKTPPKLEVEPDARILDIKELPGVLAAWTR